MICENPPSGDFGLQVGETDLAADLETTVTIERDGLNTRFRGPVVNGPKGDRFVYLAVRGGDAWRRRWKLSLEGIPWAEIEAAETVLTRVVLDATRPKVGWKNVTES